MSLSGISLAIGLLLSSFATLGFCSPLQKLQEQTSYPPLNANDASAQNEARAAHCHTFARPVHFAKRPMACEEHDDCQKRLVDFVCEGHSPKQCDQQELWQSVTSLVGIAHGVEILKTTRRKNTNSATEWVCWYIR